MKSITVSHWVNGYKTNESFWWFGRREKTGNSSNDYFKIIVTYGRVIRFEVAEGCPDATEVRDAQQHIRKYFSKEKR